MIENKFENIPYSLWVENYYTAYDTLSIDTLESLKTDTRYEIDELKETIIDKECKIKAIEMLIKEKKGK